MFKKKTFVLLYSGIIAMCYNLMKEEILVRLQDLKADIIERLQDVSGRMRR